MLFIMQHENELNKNRKNYQIFLAYFNQLDQMNVSVKDKMYT